MIVFSITILFLKKCISKVQHQDCYNCKLIWIIILNENAHKYCPHQFKLTSIKHTLYS